MPLARPIMALMAHQIWMLLSSGARSASSSEATTSSQSPRANSAISRFASVTLRNADSPAFRATSLPSLAAWTALSRSSRELSEDRLFNVFANATGSWLLRARSAAARRNIRLTADEPVAAK